MTFEAMLTNNIAQWSDIEIKGREPSARPCELHNVVDKQLSQTENSHHEKHLTMTL